VTETLTPERAVRLLRAKAAEVVALHGLTSPTEQLADGVALIATLLAEHIERVELEAKQWNEAQP
jgi:hypothetical protein